MPGQSQPILSKRLYNFVNGSATFVAAKAVPVVNWTQGSLLARVHDASFTGSSKIEVIAKTTAPSAEEPSVDFIATGAAVATATIDSGNTAGDVEKAALGADFGAFLQITIVGTLDTGNCSATISIDLVVKD